MKSVVVMKSAKMSGLAVALVAGLTASTLVASPASAAPVVTVATKASVTKAKKKPGFRSNHARVGVTRSGSVRNLQRALIKKRYATKTLRRVGATGNYLKATRQSVRKAQRKMGYRGSAADGVVGKASATKLGLRWLAPSARSSAPKKSTGSSSSTPAAGLKVATFPGGKAQLSGSTLKSVIKKAGFKGAAICQAWGIAMRESGGYPGIMSAMNSNKTYDHGLFQINDVHRANISFGSIYNAQYNANYAFTLSNRGTNFSHWGIGNSGWAGQLKKQNKTYWQMLQNIAANYTAQCNKF